MEYAETETVTQTFTWSPKQGMINVQNGKSEKMDLHKCIDRAIN